MNIPNDTGHPWRLNKFVKYHSLEDSDANFQMLRPYTAGMEDDDKFWVAFLYSCCYCVPTTCYLYEHIDLKTVTPKTLDAFWAKEKSHLIFQSDKRYAKNMNWFLTMVNDFVEITQREPAKFFSKFVGDNPQKTYNLMYKEFTSWKYYGRFTTFLLIEAIDKLTDINCDSDWFDWRKGDTATSGMLHLLYLDDKANEFDATGALSVDDIELLTKRLPQLKTAILKRYPDVSIKLVDLETSLCAFRKLFKGTRYAGYYYDRGLVELRKMEHDIPTSRDLWKRLYKYRKDNCPDVRLLGEIGGWNGVRKERKKLWTTQGLTGVEDNG